MKEAAEKTSREKVIDKINNSLSGSRIQVDNPNVEIEKIRANAIRELATDNNPVFSELHKDKLQDESLDYARALEFSRNPMPQLEERLNRMGFYETKIKEFEGEIIEERSPIRIQDTVMENFLIEFKKQRHCINRKRVDEYIDAIDKSTSGRLVNGQPETERKGILNRMG